MWFFFGALMIKRGLTNLNDLDKYKGQLTEIGTTITIDLKGRKQDILYFKLLDLNQTLGIYHNTNEDYNYYLNRLNIGDIIVVYFDSDGVKADNINLHVFQLEHNGRILLNHELLTKSFIKVGLILFGVGLVFAIAPIWFYQKRIRKKTTANSRLYPMPHTRSS
jgi:hypothetical protein